MADFKPAVLQAAGPVLAAEGAASRARPNVKLIGLLALGHLVIDVNIGTGGLAVTLLGFVADHYGLSTALWISALMPLAGFTAARYLPAPRSLVTQ